MKFNLKKENLFKLKKLRNFFKQKTTEFSLKECFSNLNALIQHSGVNDINFVLENFSTDKIGSTIIKNLKNKIIAKSFFEKTNNYRKYTCCAPYTSLNFDKSGNVTACCFSRSFSLGAFPKQTIKEIWFGAQLEQMRADLQNYDFSKGCNTCLKHIVTGNFDNSLLKKFDYFKNYISKYPAVFEFELSNTCNFECIMCSGFFSSSIRKNREKLPGIPQIYDKVFIDQLKEFIPHLKVCNFLGGEPFLIPIYYNIWEEIYKINKDINIYATTNGSIFNDKVKEIVEKLPKFKLIFSIDSLKPDTYSFIRKNGNLDKLKECFYYFLGKNRVSGIAYCPMIQNIYELPDIIKLCEKYNLDLSINTVQGPIGGRIKGIHENGDKEKTTHFTLVNTVSSSLNDLLPEVSLFTLSKERKTEIVEKLSKFKFSNYYQKKLDGVINSLKIS